MTAVTESKQASRRFMEPPKRLTSFCGTPALHSDNCSEVFSQECDIIVAASSVTFSFSLFRRERTKSMFFPLLTSNFGASFD
jgi:hypothetical protein